MSGPASAVAGVVESVLARVLDAFQQRVTAALGGSVAGALAGSAQLARLMAAEAAAPQAGEAAAFFVGRSTDSIDAFVTDVLKAGAALPLAAQAFPLASWVCVGGRREAAGTAGTREVLLLN